LCSLHLPDGLDAYGATTRLENSAQLPLDSFGPFAELQPDYSDFG